MLWSLPLSSSSQPQTAQRVGCASSLGLFLSVSFPTISRLAIVYTNTTATVKRILLKFLDQPVSLKSTHKFTAYACMLLVFLLGSDHWYGFSRVAWPCGLLSIWSRDPHHEDVAHTDWEWWVESCCHHNALVSFLSSSLTWFGAKSERTVPEELVRCSVPHSCTAWTPKSKLVLYYLSINPSLSTSTRLLQRCPSSLDSLLM